MCHYMERHLESSTQGYRWEVIYNGMKRAALSSGVHFQPFLQNVVGTWIMVIQSNPAYRKPVDWCLCNEGFIYSVHWCTSKLKHCKSRCWEIF